MNKHKDCLVCKSGELRPLPKYTKHGLVKCKVCGFVFCGEIPSDQTLNEHYKNYSYTKEITCSPLTKLSYQNLLKELEPYRKNNKILDVGCGRGFFLETAREMGWEVYGTEFSATACQLLRDKNITIAEGVLSTNSFNNVQFDVITSFEVIEHINNPIEEVEKFYEILRPNGLLYITTPNFNSYLRYILKAEYNVITYPEHLSYYTKKTLGKLLVKSRFKKKKILTTGVSLSRFANSSGKVKKELSNSSKDEKLRNTMNANFLLKAVKKLVNIILSITGLGMTLKGYFVKK